MVKAGDMVRLRARDIEAAHRVYVVTGFVWTDAADDQHIGDAVPDGARMVRAILVREGRTMPVTETVPVVALEAV